MKVIVTGKNLSVNDRVKEYMEEKVGKFERYFQTDIEVHATFSHRRSQNKNFQIVELTIPLKTGGVFRVQSESEDMFASIDEAIDTLQKQITKHKTKLEKRYRSNETIRFEQIPQPVEEEEKLEIVRTKKFPVKPMDPEEAVLQMEMMGHDFFVFRNGDTDEINIVYARKDGKFGLIEPENL